MKKILFVVIVLTLSLSACSPKENVSTNIYSTEYQQACYDIGGLMGKDGCVLLKDNEVKVEETKVDDSPDPCLVQAEALNFPKELSEYVCAGSYGNGAIGPLSSGTEVSFGTITVDNASSVWILQNFIVPNWSNYSFEFFGTEKNIFGAPFLNGNKECFNPDTGKRTEVCKVCFNTTSPGCELDIDFFD